MIEHFAALVAMDWADDKHDVCLLDTATDKKEALTIKLTPEALHDWATSLRTRFPGPQDRRLLGTFRVVH